MDNLLPSGTREASWRLGSPRTSSLGLRRASTERVALHIAHWPPPPPCRDRKGPRVPRRDSLAWTPACLDVPSKGEGMGTLDTVDRDGQSWRCAASQVRAVPPDGSLAPGPTQPPADAPVRKSDVALATQARAVLECRRPRRYPGLKLRSASLSNPCRSPNWA